MKNGTLGTLVAIAGAGAGAHLKVRLDSGREVVFALKDYDALDHGYAATMHKAQGVTVDHAHVLLSASMDRHLTYVALSRHRESVRLHWSEEEMGNSARMAERLARARRKESTLDYEPAAVAPTGFAVRRGLVPESAILVPEARPAPPRAMPQPAAAARVVAKAPAQKPGRMSWLRQAMTKAKSAIVAMWPSSAPSPSSPKVSVAKPPPAAKPVVKAQTAQSMAKAATMMKVPPKAPAPSSATVKSSAAASAPSRQAPGAGASSPQMQRPRPVAEPAPEPPAAPNLTPRPEPRPAPPAMEPARAPSPARVPEAAPAATLPRTPGAARRAEIFVPNSRDKIIAPARGKIPQPRPEPEPTPEPEPEPPSMGMGM